MNSKTATVDRVHIPAVSKDSVHIERFLTDVDEQLQSISELEDDWNDEGAPSIDAGCVERARTFSVELARLLGSNAATNVSIPSVFPSIDGGVRLTWRINNRRAEVAFRKRKPELELSETVESGVTENNLVSAKSALEFCRRFITRAAK